MAIRIPRSEVAQAGGVVRRTVNAAGGGDTARGAQALAAGIGEIGGAALEIANRIQEERGRQALTDADLEFRRRAADKLRELEQDPDVDTLAERGVAELGKIRSEVAAGNKRLKGRFAAAFQAGTAEDIERRRNELMGLQRRKQVDSLNAEDQRFLAETVVKFIDDPTARREDRDDAIAAYRLRLQSGVENGRYTQQQAQAQLQELKERRRKADQRYALEQAETLAREQPERLLEGLSAQQYEDIDPVQRERLGRTAVAEVARREAEAQREAERSITQAAAGLRRVVSTQLSRVQAGLPMTESLADEVVRDVLGDEVADTLLVAQREGEVRQQIGLAPSSQVSELLGRPAPAPEAPLRAHQLHAATQRAAEATLKARREDPVAFAANAGLLQDGLSGVLASGSLGDFMAQLPDRVAAMTEISKRLGTPNVPLSRQEIGLLGAAFEGMGARDRVAFLGELHRNAGSGYRQIVQGLRPDSPVTAVAGALTASPFQVRGMSGPKAAEIILEGEEALRPTRAEGKADGKPRYVLPTEDSLQREWRNFVGEAYAGQQEAEAVAFQAFKSAYAGLSFRDGDQVKEVDSTRSRHAAELATGGVVKWGGRKPVLLPWGMNATAFTESVRAYWPQLIQNRGGSLTGTRPTDWNLRPVGQGRYQVVGARGADGKDVVINVGAQGSLPSQPARPQAAPPVRVQRSGPEK